MAAWVLVPCLVELRREIDRLAPNRDKASDGSIGDQAHAGNSSDHNPDETGRTPYEDADSLNEVHAIDVDAGLRRPGWSMQRVVDIITTRHREGRDNRLQNVIYDRRIWSATWGWTARAYTGSNPHTEHAHFSSRYTSGQESDTRPWGLLDEGDDVTKSEFTAWMTEWAKSADGRDALGQALMRARTGSRAYPGRDFGDFVLDVHGLRDTLIGDGPGTKVAAIRATSPLGQLLGVSTQLGHLDVPTPAENATAVLGALRAGTAAETAAALRVVLGDQADEVGRLLAVA